MPTTSQLAPVNFFSRANCLRHGHGKSLLVQYGNRDADPIGRIMCTELKEVKDSINM